MAKYRFSNKAVEDLSDIWNYTFETWSENQADKYYKMLTNFCKEIAENPSLGENYEEVTEHLFGFKASKHIIFYRIIAEDEIEVVRILHERMDLRNRIRE
jgi:toxin ParE1/3/4